MVLFSRFAVNIGKPAFARFKTQSINPPFEVRLGLVKPYRYEVSSELSIMCRTDFPSPNFGGGVRELAG